MRVAYVIAAHRGLGQLERLIRRLDDDQTTIVVHVDRRAGEAAYVELRRRTADLDRVRWLPRHLGYWGGFGVVRAALEGIRLLEADALDYDYAALLSGQDYPLRSPSAIRDALAEAEGHSFMTDHRLPFEGWGPRGGFDRVEDWHLVSR
ncbi:MAG: beta-1,6-N-acetylglucosaminyltransferase, partial [Gaiellaceae bacterium]